jgi:L-histidine N-alpha-methyltransferase
VHGVVGDFDHHLGCIPGGGRRLIAFLGGTIGNLEPAGRKAFLADLTSHMVAGDGLLLGTDLVKDPARLVQAYDDSAGVTADFNRNVLRVVNRELGGDFHPDQFVHVARWDSTEEWIEMHLRSTVDQEVRVADLGLTVGFAKGEEMRTEISAKFRRHGISSELGEAGFDVVGWWTDQAGDFAVSLSFLR